MSPKSYFYLKVIAGIFLFLAIPIQAWRHNLPATLGWGLAFFYYVIAYWRD